MARQGGRRGVLFELWNRAVGWVGIGMGALVIAGAIIALAVGVTTSGYDTRIFRDAMEVIR